MINVKDPSTLGALAMFDGAIPEGVVRNYRAAGAHNPTNGTITLKVYLVPKNGVANDGTLILNRAVQPHKTDICVELIGRGLNAGGSLWIDGTGLTFGYTSLDTIVS